MNRFARCGAAGAVALLLAAGCSSATDNTQIASGPGEPVVTTPPLAIPPVLRQPESSAADVMPDTLATTSPLTMPTEAPPTSTAVAVATTPGATAPDPTVMPIATSTTTAAVTPVPTVSTATATTTAAAAAATAATSTTAAAVTPVPTVSTPTAATAAAAAVVPATNAANAAPIALGDFEVVNLVTGSNQNIAELSPSGATMLWFWAPH